MSNRYKGGVISATPPTLVAGAGASGAWTLEQQMQATAAGLWPVNGPFFIEDVFSTYLYTGNGSTQTITNGIDLSTKGGLVWIKRRDGAGDHTLTDTVRGASNVIYSNATSAQSTDTQAGAYSYLSDGFSVFSASGFGTSNRTSATYVSWTFRKQPKFFDVVTYTGNGTNGRTVAHSLGSVPGCMIVKRTDAANGWAVYHRSMNASPQDYMMRLNATDAAFTTSPSRWNNTLPTSTEFTLSGNDEVNGSGFTYVAYLFAHDAGGFGLTGSDNVISCGSYVGNGGVLNINVGFEPQWLLIKQATGSGGNWSLVDNMQGVPVLPSYASYLAPNTSDAETVGLGVHFNATGFNVDGFGLDGSNGETYIYIAIRRGPMKVPTSGTSVFAPVLANGGNTTITTNFPVDLLINKPPSSTNAPYFMDRLRGGTTNTYNILQSSSTSAELVGSGLGLGFQSNVGIQSSNSFYSSGTSVLWLNFRRAPSFFDEVCWTGNNGSNQRVSHNLGVVPELIIYKGRNKVNYWRVYFGSINTYIQLDAGIAAVSGSNLWGSSAPTTTDFGINCGSMDLDNFNAVAYLFATCAGVSKVGSYTGTATTKQIDCGFTGGARFVLIKRTDSTGDWYVWDSARGIVAGNDPYLLLNSTAAEVTGTDYVDTYSAGFEISSTAPAAINANGGTFIFLAIA